MRRIRSTPFRFSCFVVWCALGLGACSAYDEELLANRRGAAAADRGKVASFAGGSAGGSAAEDGAAVGSAADRATGGSAAAGEGTAEDTAASTPPRARVCVSSAGSDYCSALPALPDAPILDGELECGLELSPMEALGWSGTAPEPSKRAMYAAAWRNDGLYLYVEVHGADPLVPHPAAEPIFCGDALELFVDANAAVGATGSYQAGTMQFVVAAPTEGASGVEATRYAQGTSQGAWITQALHVARLPDGFNVEAFIGAADLGLWHWTPSAHVGFNVGVDVAGPGGSAAAGCSNRAGQFFLRLGAPAGTCLGEPWCDAGAFCRAELK